MVQAKTAKVVATDRRTRRSWIAYGEDCMTRTLAAAPLKTVSLKTVALGGAVAAAASARRNPPLGIRRRGP